MENKIAPEKDKALETEKKKLRKLSCHVFWGQPNRT